MTSTTPAARSKSLACSLAAACVMAALGAVATATANPDTSPVAAEPKTAQAQRPAGTLDRIKNTSRIALGYRADAAPMSYRGASGQPEGYSVELCKRVAQALKRALARPSLDVEWVPVSSGFSELAAGRVDLICAADEITLANRARASFSIPVFPGGVSALVRTDADATLQDALEERPAPYAPLWRGTPPPTLERRTYSALGGSYTMTELLGHVARLHLKANVEPVADNDAGLAAVLQRRSNVLFGDREKLLWAVRRNPDGKVLRVLTRRFTFALLALAVPRNDDDFRLAVDRALSGIYEDSSFEALYMDFFGVPDTDTVAFFRNVGVPADLPIREPR